jgi:peroxiredoxin
MSLISLTLAAIALAPAAAVESAAKVGAVAPSFTLTDTKGQAHNLADFKGKFVVLEWTNHQCPVVVRHYRDGNMQKTQAWALKEGAVWLSIVSSAPGKQGYVTAEAANEVIAQKGHKISAKLLDPNGKVGKLYGAKTTPHMYVIDPNGTLIYNGAIDDSPSGEASKAKNLVVAAITEAKAGKPVSVPTSQPYGCSVKY